MRKAAEIEAIKRVVTETISKDFDNVRIVDVRVSRDIDIDDDDVLRIEVIFEGTPKSVNAKKVAGAVRHVRPKLIDLGEHAFPLFSFISQRDVRIGGREAARPA